MLNNRTLLIGIGLGIIVGAILMQLMLYVDKQDQSFASQNNINSETSPLTKATLLSEAARLEFQVHPKDEKLFTQKDLDAKLKVAAASKPVAPKPEQPAQTEIKLYIHKGMDSASLAAILTEIGVIDDADAFVELMTIKKANRKIQAGLFTFKGKETPQDVIRIITTFE